VRQQFKRLTILQKFSVAIILIFTFAGLTISTLIISKQKRALREEIYNNQVVIITNFVKEAVDALVSMDPLRLDEMIKVLASTPGFVSAAIVDNNLRVVGHSQKRNLGRHISELNKDVTQETLISAQLRTRLIKDEGLREIIVPIKAGYETLGLFVVSFSVDSVEAVVEHNLKDINTYFIIVIASSMLLSIWGAFWLARLITTPIKRLKNSMELVQEGNLQVEIPNDNLVNCWEVFRCRLTDCPAYGRQRCWELSGTIFHRDPKRKEGTKITECKNCIVYQRSCGDEIGELIEVFNKMIRDLRDSLQRLEESNSEKARLERLSALGEMAMTVAHEIKNPLNAIKGSVSYLKDNFKGQVLVEFLSIIEEETRRLNEIVTTFMRFSRPSPLKMQISDIQRCISDTVELVRQEATEKNVEVAASVDSAIAPFYFDPHQFKQALLNLLVNAIEATKEGDSVKIKAFLMGQNVVVSVSDTGEGMTEEVVANIFKPFFTTKTRGTGLGLACVERIVKDHHGEITVKSTVGKGTEFIITLPYTRGQIE
jgi:signal transduction histidine kinase